MDRHPHITFECEVFPHNLITTASARVYMSKILLHHRDDQYFNINVTYEKWYWIVPTRNHALLEHQVHRIRRNFSQISKDALQRQVDTIISMADVSDAFRRVVEKKILACAEKMANVTHKNQKILHMNVTISKDTRVYNHDDDDDDDDDDSVVEESLENNGGRKLVPASRSSIEALERVEIDEQEELCDCAICCEDFKVDSDDVVRMPCLHLFHKKCIVTWLERVHFCPLCRFQMPTSDN